MGHRAPVGRLAFGGETGRMRSFVAKGAPQDDKVLVVVSWLEVESNQRDFREKDGTFGEE